MRKLILLLLLPVLAGAQSYSRWNYSDSQPNNATADAAMVAFYAAAMENHGQGEVRIATSYTYPAATDSSFELPDIDSRVIRLFNPTPAPDGATELQRENTVVILTKRSPAQTDSSFELPDIDAQVIRLFDPTPAPDGVTELAREDTVIILTKQSPLKKRQMVGGDGILPPGQSVRPLDTFMAWAARKEAQALRKAVDDSIRVNPPSGNTKAKRAKVWKAVKAKKKADKVKAAKLQ